MSFNELKRVLSVNSRSLSLKLKEGLLFGIDETFLIFIPYQDLVDIF